jgi:hypothetical protein
MVDQAPLTPEDLRADARNTLRLAQIARSDRLKAKLLHAANEFLNKAAELEAAAAVIEAPSEVIKEITPEEP